MYIIKRCTAVLTGLLILSQSSLSANDSLAKKQNSKFVHATYLDIRKIRSKEELKKIQLNQFNFIYMFLAGPQWKVEDFDLPEKEAIKKLVTNHSYPKGESGFALVPEIIRMAHKQNVKILISAPARRNFNPIAADSKKRKLFAKLQAAFCHKYNFDGVEVDWEGFKSKSDHTKLMGNLRACLNKYSKGGKRKYYVTTALHTYIRYSSEEARLLGSYVDWINVMTYDMGGGRWGKVATHNTPLNAIKERLTKRWKVFPRNKICIGFANYGFHYKGIKPGQKCGHLRKDGQARYISYKNFQPYLKSGWTESYDKKAEAPYYFSPDKNEFITIDNMLSHRKKTEWVIANKYRGIFWWEFTYDYYPDGNGKKTPCHPMIDNVSSIIHKAENK